MTCLLGKSGVNNNVLEYGYGKVSWLKGIMKFKARGFFFLLRNGSCVGNLDKLEEYLKD